MTNLKTTKISLVTATFAVIVLVTYQYFMMSNRIRSLENNLQQAQGTMREQITTIKDHENELKEREEEVKRKGEELQEKTEQIQGQEKQIQEQRTQLQLKEESLRSQRAELEQQQKLSATLKDNTETLGICLAGVSLAIEATTPFEKEKAFAAIIAKCEEAGEILKTL
jgi:chromosome segregation ATPase